MLLVAVSSFLKRWWWLILLLPVTLGLARLRFDVDVLNLLPDHVPVVQGLKLYQEHFTSVRELVVTVRAADADTAESAARQLAEFLRRETNLVADAVWQPPWLDHPEEMAELIAYLWLNQPPEALSQLANQLAADKLDAFLANVRRQLATSLSPLEIARLSYDPYGFTRLPETALGGDLSPSWHQDWFASADGAFRVVYVEAHGELPDYRACAQWLDAIQASVVRCQNSQAWPGKATVRWTGTPAFVTEIATGMERDMKGSAMCTLILIAGLFWWAHRTWRPLLWILALLMLIVAGALASGSLIFGKLNAVSLGFAAILLGLAVDYGLVLYQEWVAAPHLSAPELRRILAPSILWSATTTAAAFGLMNFAGLPGLSQLGSLVAIGVLLAAIVMLYGFPPVALCKKPGKTATRQTASNSSPKLASASPRASRIITVVIACMALAVLWRSWPRVDHDSSPLQPRNSQAQAALNELETELNRQGEPLLLVVSGRDEKEVAGRLDAVSAHFSRMEASREVRRLMLPTPLWPHAERQRINLATVTQVAAHADSLHDAGLRAGFNSDALGLAAGVLRTWEHYRSASVPIWPTNRAGEWMLKRAVARDGEDWLAAGAVYPATEALTARKVTEWDVAMPGVWLTGWRLLGEAILGHVEHRLWWLVAAMVAVLCVCLRMALHRWSGVLLSLATLGFSLLVLLAVMGPVGWSWNLMNLMALPLMLGAGVDYTIHVQLALRRHAGDVLTMRRITGRAVFLSAATTAAGFGSNALSTNAGLASLGLVCATGIAAVYFSSVYLLPGWWSLLNPNPCAVGTALPRLTDQASRLDGPSFLYRAWLWRVELAVVRVLPVFVLNPLCLLVAEIYYRLRHQRRRTVIQNLLPALNNNRIAAERTARALFHQFALKMADLWRYESGRPVRSWLTEPNDWETFQSCQARGQGVLLITPHLGNWELGGQLLTQRGVKLMVITQPEPGNDLTELRMGSRAKRGIETLVIRGDGFVFVDVIKRLQAGATVALLFDRPATPSAVTVKLFDRPFHASVAAAELARATGCALLGVTIVRTRGGYTARLLPEFAYERQALSNREARRELTQQILRAFEPEIRQHLEQWFHFVPIWPDTNESQV